MSCRTGTIQAGDKLLAVDNLRTNHVGVEEAAQALQDANDIVRLRIHRDDSFVGSNALRNKTNSICRLCD